MNELNTKLYFRAGEIVPCDLRNTNAGYFTTLLKDGSSESTLVLGTPDDRSRVVLAQGKYHFNVYPVVPRDMIYRPGFLIAKTSIIIEGVGSTAYDATNVEAAPGDIVLLADNWFIAANDTQGYRDTVLLGLWNGQVVETSEPRIGFRGWRMLVGEGDEQRILYERVPG